MAFGAGSDWMYLQVPPGQGSNTWGGCGQPIRFRDSLDASRSMMTGRLPQAEYPDGYLGNVRSRREDRLMTSVKSRLTQRNYQRGVHKGERIDPNDYFWTPEFNPDTGLAYEARGLKWTAKGSSPAEQLINGGSISQDEARALRQRTDLPEPGPVVVTDPHKLNQLLSLRPSWF